jgi:glutathione reductase (NADPH)
MARYDYDLFVIGGGSGGVRAARMAAALGKRVAIAEEHRFGGTCVVRGCVPKKLFVYASQYSEHFADAAGYGWSVPEPGFDWKTLVARKDREITRLERIYRVNLESSGSTTFHSRAVLMDQHSLRNILACRRHSGNTLRSAPSEPTGPSGLRCLIHNLRARLF